MHKQYAHSRLVRSTSYFKNLIRYVASYIQGDSARYRRSLLVSRASKFAQALARPPDVWRRLSLAWVTLLLSWDTPWSLLGIDRSLPLLTGSRGCLRIAGTRFALFGLLELAVDVACSLRGERSAFHLASAAIITP